MLRSINSIRLDSLHNAAEYLYTYKEPEQQTEIIPGAEMAAKKIAVIGAGVLGLAVARSLALKGAEVTVFERGDIGAGTSTTTFAWINSNGKSPESYHRLNALAIDEHVRLQRESTTEGRWLLETGTWEWATNSDDRRRLNARANELIAAGYPARQFSPEELQRHIPELHLVSQEADRWYFPGECLVTPGVFLAWLTSELRAHNVELNTHRAVVALQENDHGATIHLADGSAWHGDSIVIAAGRWSAELAAMLGQQLAMIDTSRPNKIACGFLATTTPVLTQLRSNLITPGLNIRPEGGGRLLLQATDLDVSADPARPPEPGDSVGEEMLKRLRRVMDNMASARIERIVVGQRSRPADGLPGLGYISSRRRVYLMVTHSGMTLAPLVGRVCADEIVDDERSALLDDFSPQRLLGKRAEDFPAFPTQHYPAAQ